MNCKARNIIKSAQIAFNNAKKNPKLIEQTIKECSKNLKIINTDLKTSKATSDRHHLGNALCILQGFRAQLKNLRIISGAGYNKSHPNRANYRSCRIKWEDVQTAFNNRIRTGVILNLTHKEPLKFFEDCAEHFYRRIKNILKKEQALKANTIFCGEFVKIKEDEEMFEYKYFNTKNAAIYNNTDIRKWFIEYVKNPILKDLEEFQEKDSGWALSNIINLSININKFTPQLGSSYIELPKQIANKYACINVKNSDNACFAWAVVSALYPADKHPERVSKYPNYAKVLNLTGIQFPMTSNQILRFEQQNNISINVYILKKNDKKMIVLPSYLTKNKMNQHVNLLVIQNIYYCDNDDSQDDCEEHTTIEPVRYHYVWIKNLSRLLSSQVSKRECKKFFCDRCLHYFYTSIGLEKHIEDCTKLNECKIRLPNKEQKDLKFKNYKNKIEAPFIIYADIECLLRDVNEGNKYQNHEPCNIGYYVKCSYDDTLSFYKSYRGKECIEWFMRELKQFAEDLETVFLCPLPMNNLTKEEKLNLFNSTMCHICERSFTNDDIKVRDHCHLTGKYRGPAHDGCNINYQDSHIVPIVFHNLSGYDSHFIIKNLAMDLEGRIDLLPINKEKYISFTKTLEEYIIKFRFIDSFRFMSSSLDTLSSYLSYYPILKSENQDLSESQFNLLTRKGVYPYDYFNTDSKFLETSLPHISQFYNKLNDTNINEGDYAHACRIWKEFNIKNLGEYSDLYLKNDVLLLADVFEQFRLNCFQTFGLDPAHYFTLPGYTWDAMFKHTNITLELLTDIDMLMFIERGIRGGLSQCSKRYAKANNKYMNNYDESIPQSFLIYNDVNNQYGWAMSQALPYGGFKWVENYDNLNFEEIPDDSPIGYILEVDLEYAAEHHDIHKDLPFCPEHRCAPNSKEEKLMATLYNKTKYIIHYRNLKQALKYGLKLTKLHRVLQFNQSFWLKSYIDLNTKLRTLAKNEFEKNLFKLMINAIFGKTMENVRKHSSIKLVTKWLGRYGAEALINKPQFKSSTIFAENLVAIELNKTEIYFNKPIYVGMCILDLAKTTLYNFHYNYMVPQFGTNCSVCYTDTDSLIYEINCPDFYEIIKRDCGEYFDTSDYPPNNIWNIPLVNKKVPGLMKDENNGRIMTEFVGLRSKMYAIQVDGKDKIKKSKGIKKNIVNNRLTFNDYTDCLNSNTEKIISQNLIQSQQHNVNSISQTKVALSPHDDKRFIIKHSNETLPWGHYKIIDLD